MRTKSLLQVRRLLWAVDPFAEQMELQRAALWAIRLFTRNNPSAHVHPVYLVNDYSADIPQRLVASFLEKTYALGQDSIDQLLHRSGIPHVEKLTVLSRPFESLKQGTQALLTYSDENDIDLIIASTHARETREPDNILRWNTGSFSETLISRSDVPVLLVNPRWKKTMAFKRIVFPTDFSPESKEWFRMTLKSAAQLGSSITLFHRMEHALSPSRETALRIFPRLRDHIFRDLAAAQAEANRWVAEGRKTGVKIKTIIQNFPEQSFSDALLDYVELHPSTVVVTPPLSAALSGATLRNIVRTSPGPLWIVPTTLRTRETLISQAA